MACKLYVRQSGPLNLRLQAARRGRITAADLSSFLGCPNTPADPDPYRHYACIWPYTVGLA